MRTDQSPAIRRISLSSEQQRFRDSPSSSTSSSPASTPRKDQSPDSSNPCFHPSRFRVSSSSSSTTSAAGGGGSSSASYYTSIKHILTIEEALPSAAAVLKLNGGNNHSSSPFRVSTFEQQEEEEGIPMMEVGNNNIASPLSDNNNNNVSGRFGGNSRPRSLFIAYVCWFFGGIFGLHRWYLGDLDSAREYFFSLGLCIIGWIVDFFRLPSLVRTRNQTIVRANQKRVVLANDEECARDHCDNSVTNTKYGQSLIEILIMFIPRNLAEQFSRHMNRYFLLIAMLQLISFITPVNPWTTFAPLLVIFAVSATREAIDDFMRFRSDKFNNDRIFSVAVGGRLQQICSRDIRVGSIVYLQDGDEVPCDLVLLASSSPQGICYVQTTNLDGESDLKLRTSLPQTAALGIHQIMNFRGVVECSPPNKDLTRFDSNLYLTPPSRSSLFHAAGGGVGGNNGDSNNNNNNISNNNNANSKISPTPSLTSSLSMDPLPLSVEQTLLQGTHVKNVEYIYGLAVYTGNETKLGQNKKIPRGKWTLTDRIVNRITVSIFVFQLFVVAILGIVGSVYQQNTTQNWWYLEFNGIAWWENVVIPLRFLLLNSTMIPISIKVTLDLCKIFYAKFIGWDLRMYDDVRDVPVEARNTGISEDLGSVQYILTDKTGTLTSNEMVFKKCIINGILYGHGLRVADLTQDSSFLGMVTARDPALMMFFRCIAICNSLQPMNLHSQLVYRGSSPDEEALIATSAQLGFELREKNNERIVLLLKGTGEGYALLHEFEFTSTRKRMSVVVREEGSNRILMFVKGADDVIFSRLAPNQSELERTRDQLDMIASTGLRTLVLACRELSSAEYDEWLTTYWKPASTALQQRDLRRSEAFDQLESNLILLGATAIQDRLQEDVPATVRSLREAGIRFWMLTGDKLSTAVQVGMQCSMLSSGAASQTIKIDLSGPMEVEPMLDSLMAALPPSVRAPSANESSGVTVVCTGASLAMMSGEAKRILVTCCMRATAVIMCRLSPNQKAELVRYVKHAVAAPGGGLSKFKFWLVEREPLVLSIGDGGNDVPMIQEADVGVGIVGKEGLQASRAADFSVSRFKCLTRLLLVHGRYSYERTAFVAQFSFFKSWWFCWIQIFYGFASAFSGVSLFDAFAIMACNALLFIPITFYCLHRDLEPTMALENPTLYAQGPQRILFNFDTIVKWWMQALVQALGAFVIVALAIGMDVHPNGLSVGYKELGIAMFMVYVFIQALSLAAETRSFTTPQILVIIALPTVSILCYIVINSISSLSLFVEYQAFNQTMELPSMYLTLLLSITVCLLPVVSFRTFFPAAHIERLTVDSDLHEPIRSSSISRSVMSKPSQRSKSLELRLLEDHDLMEEGRPRPS